MGYNLYGYLKVPKKCQWNKSKKNEVPLMRNPAEKIDPGDYILAVLSPKERLDAALKVAAWAFKGSKITVKDVENAVKNVRRKAYEKKR